MENVGADTSYGRVQYRHSVTICSPSAKVQRPANPPWKKPETFRSPVAICLCEEPSSGVSYPSVLDQNAVQAAHGRSGAPRLRPSSDEWHSSKKCVSLYLRSVPLSVLEIYSRWSIDASDL